MTYTPSSSIGGGTLDGSTLPVAVPGVATVDSTTYDNTFTGTGKLVTLVSDFDVVLALARLGAAFPGFQLCGSSGDGLYLSNGSVDPQVAGINWFVGSNTERGTFLALDGIGTSEGYFVLDGAKGIIARSGVPAAGGRVGDLCYRYDGPPFFYLCTVAGAAGAATWLPILTAGSPLGIIEAGALPTQAFVSGAGAQVSTARDVEVHTPVTFNPTAIAAATCLVELSPDGTTYTALCTHTVPVGVAFAGTVDDVTVRVPAGWRLRLTATLAVLGTSTYY